MKENIMNFKEDICNLQPEEAEKKAIEYIQFIEDSNLDLSDYEYLNFYASFNGLLDENNKLLQEYRLNEDTSSIKSKKNKIVKHIVECINLVDRSGLNAKNYQDMFDSMSDTQFKKWMDDFCKDDDKNFYLELLPNKSEPSIYDIEKLLKKLGIPKEEYVYYRDNGFKDDPIRSREKCSVGYVTVRRLQQILSKKNTYSLDIESRNAKTGQVSGTDKIARISDSELYALNIFNADNAIKEFYTARADNMSAKMDMYSKISKYGFVYLDELNYDRKNNQTLNTIDTYLKGAGIESDLVDKTNEKAAKELQKQVLDKELSKMGLVKEDTELPKPIREYVYLAVNEYDIKRGYIDYPLTEEVNGKYVNLTLEGLETFLEKNNIKEEYNNYIKVPIDKVEIMLYDEPTEGAIIKLPFAYDIESYKEIR